MFNIIGSSKIVCFSWHLYYVVIIKTSKLNPKRIFIQRFSMDKPIFASFLQFNSLGSAYLGQTANVKSKKFEPIDLGLNIINIWCWSLIKIDFSSSNTNTHLFARDWKFFFIRFSSFFFPRNRKLNMLHWFLFTHLDCES